MSGTSFVADVVVSSFTAERITSAYLWNLSRLENSSRNFLPSMNDPHICVKTVFIQ